MAASSRLLQLPAELRNAIYELAFTTKHDLDEKVDLLAAKPPDGKALLATCRQVYNEACELYKTKYREFWTTSSFVVTVNGVPVRNQVASPKTADIENISTLEVVLGSFGHSDIRQRFNIYTLVDKRGGWCVDGRDYIWAGYGAGGRLVCRRAFTKEELSYLCSQAARKLSFSKRLWDTFGVPEAVSETDKEYRPAIKGARDA